MINSIIQKLYNYPCWLVKQGQGSFLTFEFGEPYLEIREPQEVINTESKKVKEAMSLRRVTVRGKWHLWIYCCDWEISYKGKELAHSESTINKIKDALSYIDGQKLINISIESSNGNTTFNFDLGGQLVTKGYNEDLYEQWLLYEPNGKVLTVRNDGKYSYQYGDVLEEKVDWL